MATSWWRRGRHDDGGDDDSDDDDSGGGAAVKRWVKRVLGARRRRWLGSGGVQALGALSTLAVGLLIAAWQGPQAQGRYGLVRSGADLLLALAAFGLPQGVVHLVNHRRAVPAQVAGWMARYVGALCLLAAALVGLAWWWGFDWGQPAAGVTVGIAADGASGAAAGAASEAGRALADPGAAGRAALWPLAALAVGVTGWLVHALQRAFVLCRGGMARFSWLTVAPALSLLAAVAALAAAGSVRYEYALAASGLFSAGCGAAAVATLRRAPSWQHGDGAARPADLLVPSGHALVQTASLALQPWLALQLLSGHASAGVGSQALGWFVLAGYVYQAFALPASFVAPLLYARAAHAAGQADLGWAAAAARGPIRLVGGAALAAALAAALLLPWAVPALLGPAYAGAVGVCVAMALGGPALLVGRLHTALLLGDGRFATVTALFALRAALVPVCIWALWRWTPLAPATAAAAGVALAETVVSVLQALDWQRGGRQSGSAAATPP